MLRGTSSINGILALEDQLKQWEFSQRIVVIYLDHGLDNSISLANTEHQ